MAAVRKPSTVSIRTVGPFDLGRLSRLHRGCFEEAWSRSDLAHLLAMPGGFGLIARLLRGRARRASTPCAASASRCAGWSATRASCSRSAWRPRYRRRGVAGNLLRASMERCRAIGARQMFLEVAVDNVGAQQLYAAHGFERVGMRPTTTSAPNGDRMAAYTMRCALGGAGGWSGRRRRTRRLSGACAPPARTGRRRAAPGSGPRGRGR